MSKPAKLFTSSPPSFCRYSNNSPASQTPGGPMRTFLNTLEILVISRQHFSILELAWAVALSNAPGSTNTHQVRLAHLSAKKLVLDEIARVWPTFSRWIIAHEEVQTPSQRAAALEATRADICFEYLSLKLIDSEELFSEELVAIPEMPDEDNLFGDLGSPDEYDQVGSFRGEQNHVTPKARQDLVTHSERHATWSSPSSRSQ
ncbi:hypothetical protein E4U21_002444 [Claviceps maximensis]|nr:hypothetical protein E4U21_002444 [Claviceps maximensis]